MKGLALDGTRRSAGKAAVRDTRTYLYVSYTVVYVGNDAM